MKKPSQSSPVPAPDDATPALPHLSAEFLAWLWYASERDGGVFDVGPAGTLQAWVDERLSFRAPGDDRPRVVLTGENPSGTLEAKAALLGGKVVRDLRIVVRREEREYAVTLRGVHLDLHALKLPAHVKDAGRPDEGVYERMFLVEDLWDALGMLYRLFAAERTASEWERTTLSKMKTWAASAAVEG